MVNTLTLALLASLAALPGFKRTGDKAGFYPVRIAVTNPSATARTVKLACLGRPVNSQPCAIERTLRMRSVAGGLIWYNTGMVDVCELAWTPLFGAAYL